MAYRIPAVSEGARRAAHCGWVDEREWTGDKPDLELEWGLGCQNNRVAAKPSVGYEGVEWVGDVCPGWAVRSPAIVEIGEAMAAMDSGALREFFPDMSNVLAEGLLELKRSVAEYERVSTMALKEANKSG